LPFFQRIRAFITQWVLTRIAQWVLSAHLNRTPDMPAASSNLHRDHPFIASQRADNGARFQSLKLFGLIAIVIAAMFATVVGGVYSLNGGNVIAPPTRTSEIVVREVPHTDPAARELLLQLQVWRAGYEAAVENGCKVQPILTSPIGRGRP
jgi:hypothetical protein